MIDVDINFLKYLVLVYKSLLEIANGDLKDTPGERQYRIDIAARTVRQLNYLIREAQDEEAITYLRRGIIKEATWKV